MIEDTEPTPYTKEEIRALRRKVKPLTMEQYCPVPRPVNFHDLVREAVQIEDIINHPHKPMTIPKMVYPSSGLFRLAARYAFFRQFLP